MAFADEYDFVELVNESEKLVIDELGAQLAECGDDVCRCEECVLDMAAMALNTVKPLYRVTLLGSLHAAAARDEEGYAASLREAVSQAIEKVRKNPAHD
jgi:competence protein ComFB